MYIVLIKKKENPNLVAKHCARLIAGNAIEQVCRFYNSFSSLSAILRNLLKNNGPFHWRAWAVHQLRHKHLGWDAIELSLF